jgi:hypothetical protein
VEFIPVEGKVLEFEVDSSELGLFDWQFLKDDEGKISKCRFYIEGENLEAFGKKRKTE